MRPVPLGEAVAAVKHWNLKVMSAFTLYKKYGASDLPRNRRFAIHHLEDPIVVERHGLGTQHIVETSLLAQAVSDLEQISKLPGLDVSKLPSFGNEQVFVVGAFKVAQYHRCRELYQASQFLHWHPGVLCVLLQSRDPQTAGVQMLEGDIDTAPVVKI